MRKNKTTLWILLVIVMLLGCDDIKDSPTVTNIPTSTTETNTPTETNITTSIIPSSPLLSGIITTNTTLTAGQTWLLDGQVSVAKGVTLTIEAGAVIAGKIGTNAWLRIDAGAVINAEGNISSPILFTSEEALLGQEETAGQWGGVSIIGESDNSQITFYEVDGTSEAGTSQNSSGILRHIIINNSGFAVAPDEEINGLSLFGVSDKTIVENITINRSGDDGIEIWGGSVNLSDITINNVEDDAFDTDLGWSGTVDGLVINDAKGAGVEMSGTTLGTYRNVTITLGAESSEGGLFFNALEGEKVGAILDNVTVNYNSTEAGAMVIHGDFDEENSQFSHLILNGSNPNIVPQLSTDDATLLQTFYETQKPIIKPTNELNGTITTPTLLTEDTIWILKGEVLVPQGITLSIEAGTTIAGISGSSLVIEAGATLKAEGNTSNPIVFTSTNVAIDQQEGVWNQWGGIEIKGEAILQSLIVSNTSNGLSLSQISATNTIENIAINNSGGNCLTVYGGDVTLAGVNIDTCGDVYFDIDGGYSGMVRQMSIQQHHGNAGLKISGDTVPTFDDFEILHNMIDGGTTIFYVGIGGIFFNGDNTGGHFSHGTIKDNVTNGYGAIHHSAGSVDVSRLSFENITVGGLSQNPLFTGGEAGIIEDIFDANTTNQKVAY